MNQIPVKDGRSCIFRVVRVSGTIRKAEEEAIRQAKMLILAAKEQSEPNHSVLTATPQPQDEAMLNVNDDSGNDDVDDNNG